MSKKPKLNIAALKSAVDTYCGNSGDIPVMHESLRAVAVMKREHAALVKVCKALQEGHSDLPSLMKSVGHLL